MVIIGRYGGRRRSEWEDVPIPLELPKLEPVEQRILFHKELLDPGRGDMPFVSPLKIPVHPDVYNSNLYTAAFCDKILRELGTSIDYDLRMMRNRFNKRIEFEGLENFEASAYPERKMIEFGYDDAHFLLVPGGDKERILRSLDDLPANFSYDRALVFSRNNTNIEVPSWYAVSDAKAARALKNPSVLLALRNASLLFNNLGIAEIKRN